VREFSRLNKLHNVTTLGYVRATYCKRPHGDICEDIGVYAARGRKDEQMRVEGVFVDETVNLYDEGVKRYLDGVDEKVRCELPYTEKGKGMVCFLFKKR
jgi:hypothetical protein